MTASKPKQKEIQMPRDTGRGFRYQQRSREDLRERATQRGGNYDSYIKGNFKMFKPREGKNMIRILPPTWEGAKHYGYDVWVNYNVGVDNQSYLSLSEMKNEADPLAEARKQAERAGDKTLADQLKPKKRILFWLVDRMAEDEGPQLWAAPWTFDKDLANISFDEDTKDMVFIDDPENGCDVRFYKEGTGLTTNYDASKMRIMKASPLSEDQALEKDWLDFVQENQLPDVLQFYDYDHIAAAYNGQIGSRAEKKQSRKQEDEDEIETAPPRRMNRARPEPDDDENEEPTRHIEMRKPARRGDDDETERPSPQSRGAAIRERLQTRRRTEETVPFDED